MDIARDEVEDYFLTIQLEGESRIRQRGKELIMRPGCMALMAGGVPYLVAYPKPSRRLVLRIPSHDFRGRVLGNEELLPVQYVASSGLGRISTAGRFIRPKRRIRRPKPVRGQRKSVTHVAGPNCYPSSRSDRFSRVSS